jgi:hypothetical protein
MPVRKTAETLRAAEAAHAAAQVQEATARPATARESLGRLARFRATWRGHGGRRLGWWSTHPGAHGIGAAA